MKDKKYSFKCDFCNKNIEIDWTTYKSYGIWSHENKNKEVGYFIRLNHKPLISICNDCINTDFLFDCQRLFDFLNCKSGYVLKSKSDYYNEIVKKKED